MVRRFYELPSLTTLAVFEASARHLSFKMAASELNVTPGAISRQVKAIEEEMGVPLFVRNVAKGVELTPAGEELYGALASAFSKVSEVAHGIKHGGQAQNVTIACDDDFATLWLIPRIPDFWRRYPDIAVDHLITNNTKDYRRAEVELRIRYGFGAWLDESAELLFDDTIYPVCSPEFAAIHANVTAADLTDLPRLHTNWIDPDGAGWEEVLPRAGIPNTLGSYGRRFSKYSVVLQAAMADQGVALGWDRLVHDMISEGKLVRLTDLTVPAPGAYYLTTNNNRELSEAACILRSWLREMAERERARTR